jgi:hypothetical protein
MCARVMGLDLEGAQNPAHSSSVIRCAPATTTRLVIWRRTRLLGAGCRQRWLPAAAGRLSLLWIALLHMQRLQWS